MARTPDIDENYINEVIKATEAYDPAINKTQGIKLRELVNKICIHFKGEDDYIFGLLSDLGQALDNKINDNEKGANNGLATLGANGKVPNAQLPALAITDTFPVSSEVAMLAISGAEKGDIAIRSDINKSFILTGSPAGVLANWQELLTPGGMVSSVNGLIGDVNLSTSDVAEGTNLYYTNARVNGVVDPKLATKQNTLVSEINIKTINNESLLGSGNISIRTGYTTSGTYTPTITIIQNGTYVYPQESTYTVVGSIVTVYGQFALGLQNTGISELHISLPHLTISSSADLYGHGSSVNGIATDIGISGAYTTGEAHLQMTSKVTGQTATVFFSFQYRAANL